MGVLDELLEFEKAAKASGRFALDVETTGKNIRSDHLICISTAVGDKTWFVPLHQLPGAIPLEHARNWFNDHIFNDSNLSMIAHNSKFDVEMLQSHGFILKVKLIDTMIAEYMANEFGAGNPKGKVGIFGLKELVEKYFKIKRPHWKEVRDLLFIAPKAYEQYSRDDSRDAWRLWTDIEEPALKREGPKVQRLFYDLEIPLIPIMIEMETSGLVVNVEGMEKILHENEKAVEKLKKEIIKLAGKEFNIDSPDQLSEVLFHDLKIPTADIPTTKKSTQEKPVYATGKPVLKEIQKRHPIVPKLLEYRKAARMVDGFLIPILERAKADAESKIYPEFHQTRTVLGRLASSNPNGQNVPRDGGIRDCIVAPEGYVLVVGDLNQIEYRTLAHQCCDPTLLKTYRQENGDLHKSTMDAFGCTRNEAKAVNFGIVYGMGTEALAKQAKVSVSKAKEFQKKLRETYPGIGVYKKKVLWTTRKTGFVESIFGRRRRFAGVVFDAYAERQAFHHSVSASAADIIKIGMVKLYAALQKKREENPKYRNVKILAQIHDELILQAPEDIGEEVRVLVKSCMEDIGGGKLRVPVISNVFVGKTWSEAKGKK
jgi:DNA polymerase-1